MMRLNLRRVFNKSSLALVVITIMALKSFASEPIVINADNSVTITYIDSVAEEIIIQGNFFKKEAEFNDGKAKMVKKSAAEWVYTSEPLASDLYWYNFKIDDEEITFDNRNHNTTRDIATIYNYFIIKGGVGDNFVDKKIDTGTLQYLWYPSKLNGMDSRRMAIYLPNAYKSSSSKKFPVLYLLHGSGGDETAWSDCGRLVQIMDNLISSGRCQPMIVVMPNGNVNLAAAPGEDKNNPDVKPSANNMSSMLGKIEMVFVDEVVKFVDSHYRTIADKQHRAIAGLSLGGLHTLHISINNPDTFDYVGLFSAQTTNALKDNTIDGLQNIGRSWENLKQSFPFIGNGELDRKITHLTGYKDESLQVYAGFDSKLNTFFESKPKLFYIAVGTSDFTKKLNDDLRKKLIQNNYPFVYNETKGGHTWSNWRRNLIDFAPRLFKTN